MAKLVQTLTGSVSPEILGRTLIHEHLHVDWGELVGRPKVIDFDYEKMVQTMVGKLELLHNAGYGAMVECTPYGTGRYLDLFKDVAKRSPVKIIGSTGFFHDSMCPIHPIAKALDLETITDLFIREITEGMGDTLIKAGIIKCATGDGRISPNEKKILTATARARKATGCPIITHTTNNSMGMEQLDIFENEGVFPEEIIISHIETYKYAEQLLKRGVNLSIDRIGSKDLHNDEHWIKLVSSAINNGYVDQIMLSHDAVLKVYTTDSSPVKNVFDDYTYIAKVFIPKLKKAGVTDQELNIITKENPKKILTFANS